VVWNFGHSSLTLRVHPVTDDRPAACLRRNETEHPWAADDGALVDLAYNCPRDRSPAICQLTGISINLEINDTYSRSPVMNKRKSLAPLAVSTR